jgi:hypothetical protein
MNEIITTTLAPETPPDEMAERVRQLEAWGNATDRWLKTFRIEWAAGQNRLRLLEKGTKRGAENWVKDHIERQDRRIDYLEQRIRELEAKLRRPGDPEPLEFADHDPTLRIGQE